MTEISEWVVATDENGERIDLIEEAREIVAARGHAVERDEDSLHLPAFGLTLYPRGLSASSLPDGGARSITVVHVTHPAFESGLFEYQHGVGNSLRESLRFGLDQWAQLDLPVLCDATREQPEQCAQMVMSFPAEEGKAERQRRILLGPVMHMARNAQSGGEGGDEEHPFCPCCLTTNSLEVFMPLIQADTALHQVGDDPVTKSGRRIVEAAQSQFP